MKKLLIFTFILYFSVLTGCNVTGDTEINGTVTVNGEPDIKGTVNEIQSSSILVEDGKIGLIWLSLPDGTDSQEFEKGQTVAVWTDGKIRESYPAQGTALKIEVIK
ncbi:DUF3221 domain-containing protein [Neobacillus sp. NPDC093182]|uniref:DUF3221 domain-containing protein n=1 Tax=Neobacillus sp. NPDC093182 TaxID=3364297 RepID=UPI003826773E